MFAQVEAEKDMRAAAVLHVLSTLGSLYLVYGWLLAVGFKLPAPLFPFAFVVYPFLFLASLVITILSGLLASRWWFIPAIAYVGSLISVLVHGF